MGETIDSIRVKTQDFDLEGDEDEAEGGGGKAEISMLGEAEGDQGANMSDFL